MKKIFAILLAALFVLSFAASAFAIHAEIPSETQAVVGAGTTQITLGGELRIRGWYEDNIDNAGNTLLDAGLPLLIGPTPTKTNSQAWYDERVRLSLDAKVTPNVEGMVQLETDGGVFKGGSFRNQDSYTWGNFDSKPTTLSILQAWVMYSGSGLLGIPAGVKIGHMPLALGQGVFFDHTKYGDDAIVLFANPMKQLETDLLTIKFSEGPGGIYKNTNDLDGYVGIATYKIDDKNTIGLNYTYLNQSSTPTPNDPSIFTGFNKLSLQNLELAGNGNISGLGYKYSVDVQFGNVFTDAAGQDHKAKGWAAMAGLNYQLDPVNLRAMFAYGSGNKSNTNDINEFITFLGDDQHYTLVYDYQVMTAGVITGGTLTGGTDTGISNTTYYNLGLDVNPMKDLKASVDGYILRASKTDAFGSDVSKDIGWEVDAKIAYNIAKNLTYEVNAGYMHAGSFYKDLLNTPGNDIVKNPVVLMHSLTLSF